MPRLIECVPNFSEGRDPAVIRQITDQVESVEGVKLLDVDPGRATNRTVVTFVGEPEAVIEAAVRAVRKARELIDMTRHQGEHPRFGATDVCPLVPITSVSSPADIQRMAFTSSAERVKVRASSSSTVSASSSGLWFSKSAVCVAHSVCG